MPSGDILVAVRTSEQKPDVSRRVEDLVAGFTRYLDVFNQENPFTPDQLRNHARTSQLRQRLDTLTEVIGNQEFLNALHLTLESWGMNRRCPASKARDLLACPAETAPRDGVVGAEKAGHAW